MKQRIVFDDNNGVIAAVLNDEGEIIATAAASHDLRATFAAATGMRLPADLWDQAVDE